MPQRVSLTGAVLFCALCVKTSTAIAAAALPSNGLGPEQDWMSDMYIGGVSGSYDAVTGDFSLSGTASAFDVGVGGASDFMPFYAPASITGLVIDNAGNVTTPGSFVVELPSAGNLPDFLLASFPTAIGNTFAYDQTLVEGSVVDVGFFGGELQMLIEITGGAAADYFSYDANNPDPALEPPADVVSLPFAGLLLNGTGATDFTASYAFTRSVVDLIGTTPTPEPASALVWSVGLVASAVVGRRRD